MKEFLRKNHLALLRLGLLAAGVFLLANLISLGLAGRFVQAPQIAAATPAAPRTKELTEDEYIGLILPVFPAPFSKPQGSSSEETSPKAGLSQALEGGGQGGNVSLLGTIIGESSSVAILSYQGEQFVLQNGEKVGDLTVQEIGKSKVILKRGTQLFTLWAQGVETQGPTTGKGLATRPGGNSDSSRIITRTMDRQKISTFLDQPQQLASSVNFTPVARDGKPYGIQIGYLESGSLLQDLGFQAGDIMININDKDLKTPEDGLLAWQMLKNEDDVSFKVDRNGRVIHIYFKIK